LLAASIGGPGALGGSSSSSRAQAGSSPRTAASPLPGEEAGSSSMAVQINPVTFEKRVKLLYDGWKVCNATAGIVHACTAQHGSLRTC
jgi:hypothetical protein